MVLLHESGWRQMTEPCLLSYPVVEDLDVLDDLPLGLLAGGKAAMMYQLGL